MTRFHLYATHNDSDISSVLGRPEYSYRFVQSYFERALQRLGETHIIKSLSVDLADVHNESDVLLSFMPPHKVPASIVGTSIVVFAWEFDTLPDEGWLGDPRNNWYSVLERSPGAITLCAMTVETVKARLGADFPIVSISAPVWDDFSPLRMDKPVHEWTLSGHGIVIDSRSPALPESTVVDDFGVILDGVVYTSVFNPNDGRKEWVDLISAFIAAHRENRDATLVLKLIQTGLENGAPVVFDVAAALGHFECRVVVVQGYLDDVNYRRLCAWSTFAVNSSRGEGQCLPLLESMSAGVPAVAPDHTAMADYVNPGNSFVVESSPQLSYWPHDPRMKYTCFTYPVVWESLRDRFIESYDVAVSKPDVYGAKCDAAYTTARSLCSVAAVDSQLAEFFETVRRRSGIQQ